MNNTHMFCVALLLSACETSSCLGTTEPVSDAAVVPELPVVDAGAEDASDGSLVERIDVDVILTPLDAGEEGLVLPPEEN